MTFSPYVRQRRLRKELIALRGTTTHEALAKASGVPKSTLSRLENMKRRPSLNDVTKILDALSVDADVWTKIYTIAQDAAGRGWWEGLDIDDRQALYADLEAGAVTIREYAQTSIPGLLQLEEFTRALTEYDDLTLASSTPASPESVIRARSGRQRLAFARSNGPTYEAILDEFAIRRPIVPPAVLTTQLRHLAGIDNERIAIRVLPLDVTIESYSTPRGGFNLYTYADPDDPIVVAVDTVTSDLVLTEVDETGPYERLYDRLRAAALSEQDSAALLMQAADQIEGRR